jgi:hypothetical protein
MHLKFGGTSHSYYPTDEHRWLGSLIMKSFKLIGHGPHEVLLFPGLIGTRDAFDHMLRYADLDAFQYAVAEYRGYGLTRLRLRPTSGMGDCVTLRGLGGSGRAGWDKPRDVRARSSMGSEDPVDDRSQP